MQHPPAMIFVIHIDKIDNDDAAEITQPQLSRYRLGSFNIGIKYSLIEITVSDKGTGINIDGRHGLGLIDNQITAGFKLNLTFEGALDLILYIIKIKNRLFTVVVFQLTCHLRDIFAGKLYQQIKGQPGVDPDTIQRCADEIAQYALCQRQFAVKHVFALVTALALHDLSPKTFKKRGILG